MLVIVFFFNDTATTEIYTLSLHDALPISDPADDRDVCRISGDVPEPEPTMVSKSRGGRSRTATGDNAADQAWLEDRKSTRLNSSHANISYAVFCLKKKKTYSNFATHPDSP